MDLLTALAYVLEVVGLVGFHALQGRNYERIGRGGAVHDRLGFSHTGEPLWGMEGLGLLVVVGVLGMLVGFVLYGVATLQAKVLPRWCGMSFIILVPGTILIFSIFAGYYSSVWEGLVWLALGYALWSHFRCCLVDR